MKSLNQRQLKKLLINPKFQIAVVLYSTTLSLLLSFVQYLSLRSFFGKYFREGSEMRLSKNHPFFDFLNEQQSYMNTIFLYSSLVVLVITVSAGLILSHRVAGPLHRLKKYLGQTDLKNSETPLSFRQGDFFQDIPPAVNEAMERLKNE